MAAARDETSEGFLDQLIGEAMNSGTGDSGRTRGVFHVILGVTGPSSEAADGDSSSPPPPDRIVLVNSVTQGMVVLQVEPAVVAEILSEMGLGGGAPPASKASIEAMRKVDVEGDDLVECIVCLEALGGGGGGGGGRGRGRGEGAAPAVTEMPCGHRYHEECIVKWLGMNGSCPVCRFQMPVEDSGAKKGDEEQEGRTGSRRGLLVTIVYSRRSSRRDQSLSGDGGIGDEEDGGGGDDDDQTDREN